MRTKKESICSPLALHPRYTNPSQVRTRRQNKKVWILEKKMNKHRLKKSLTQ